MTAPLTPQQKIIFRPLFYKHILATAHEIKNHTIYATDGWALAFKQVIRLKK